MLTPTEETPTETETYRRMPQRQTVLTPHFHSHDWEGVIVCYLDVRLSLFLCRCLRVRVRSLLSLSLFCLTLASNATRTTYISRPNYLSLHKMARNPVLGCLAQLWWPVCLLMCGLLLFYGREMSMSAICLFAICCSPGKRARLLLLLC